MRHIQLCERVFSLDLIPNKLNLNVVFSRRASTKYNRACAHGIAAVRTMALPRFTDNICAAVGVVSTVCFSEVWSPRPFLSSAVAPAWLLFSCLSPAGHYASGVLQRNYCCVLVRDGRLPLLRVQLAGSTLSFTGLVAARSSVNSSSRVPSSMSVLKRPLPRVRALVRNVPSLFVPTYLPFGVRL